MKIKKIFILILLFFQMSLAISAFEKNDFLSRSDQEEWILYIKKFRDNRFMICFPNEPILSLESHLGEKSLKLESLDNDAKSKYSLVVINKEKISDKEELLHDVFNSLKKELPIDIEKINLYTTDKGLIADFSYVDALIPSGAKNAIGKGRILVTQSNIYCFYTTFIDGKKDFHNRFISSFQPC